jgi:hypothetical protein
MLLLLHTVHIRDKTYMIKWFLREIKRIRIRQLSTQENALVRKLVAAFLAFAKNSKKPTQRSTSTRKSSLCTPSTKWRELVRTVLQTASVRHRGSLSFYLQDRSWICSLKALKGLPVLRTLSQRFLVQVYGTLCRAYYLCLRINRSSTIIEALGMLLILGWLDALIQRNNIVKEGGSHVARRRTTYTHAQAVHE